MSAQTENSWSHFNILDETCPHSIILFYFYSHRGHESLLLSPAGFEEQCNIKFPPIKQVLQQNDVQMGELVRVDLLLNFKNSCMGVANKTFAC